MTLRVLASLVMPTVRVLPVMPRVSVPLVMQWRMVSLVMLPVMARVLQGVLRPPVPLVMTTVRVLQMMVLSVGMGGRWRCWAWAIATRGGGLGGRWWSVGSPVLLVLVASGVGACSGENWRRVLLVRVV